MKQAISTTARRAAICAILFGWPAFGNSKEDAFAIWIASQAVPIKTAEIGGDDTDLAPLALAIGASHIVALGEATHGAHQPLAFRNRFFHFLVERMGFTAIALESGFTESTRARRFIESGAGDVETAASTGLPGLAQFGETLDLLRWMREYNARASSAGRHGIRLYGMDITAGGRLNGPRLAIDSALDFLSRADAATAKKIRDSLGESIPGVDDVGFGSLSPAAQVQFNSSIAAIARSMQAQRTNLIAHSSEDEFRWARHELVVARQLANCLRVTPPPSADMGAWIPAATCRDSAMAENVRWAQNNEGRQGRLLVFAHTGHVLNSKDDGRRWAKVAVNERPPMMGFHLRRMYGEDLYIIATSAATTSGGLRAAKPIEEDSIEKVLSAAGLPFMFLDIRHVGPRDEAHAWLSEGRSIDATVDAQTLITPATAADAYFFIRNLTPAIRAGSD